VGPHDVILLRDSARAALQDYADYRAGKAPSGSAGSSARSY
jgi:hypothetical protein